MGRSMKTKRYHLIEWRSWDEENKLEGELIATELYDNQVDPDENENIADVKENADLVAQLSAQLKAGWKAAKPNGVN